MKHHFIRLFNYNLFANKQIAQLVLSRVSSGKPVQLMAHILSAEQLWLMRCKGVNTAGKTSWPNWQPETFDGIISSNNTNWITFIEELDERDLDKIIRYHNSTGESFATRMSDIIAHVLNHGTHTRAQIGQLLKRDETDKLPVTDYSYYLRSIDNKS